MDVLFLGLATQRYCPAPSGGGHWSLADIGYAISTWIVNDPNGEANLVPGGYAANKDGSNQLVR